VAVGQKGRELKRENVRRPKGGDLEREELKRIHGEGPKGLSFAGGRTSQENGREVAATRSSDASRQKGVMKQGHSRGASCMSD